MLFTTYWGNFCFFLSFYWGSIYYDISLYSLRALVVELQKADEKKMVAIIKLLTVRVHVAKVDMSKRILPGTAGNYSIFCSTIGKGGINMVKLDGD